MKKIIFAIMLLFILFFTKDIKAYSLNSETDKVYLGGETVGIKLNTGVKVIKTYAIIDGINLIKPWYEAGIKEDDIIVSFNDKKINVSDDLIKELKVTKDKKTEITLLRDNEYIKTNIKPCYSNDSYSLGVYVKDNILGIGTLTYIIPNTNIFGALGHQIDGAKDVGGTLYEATVTGVKKGTIGEAGSKLAKIKTTNIGQIEKNTVTGLHGNYSGKISEDDLISVAKREEVKLGKAYIYTCIDKSSVEKFEIEIISLSKQNTKDIKGIKFRVTDERLLSKTNGIVQGMSGSPIVQNDKLIGAVTHVLVNNPHEGYGIYIEFMFLDMGVILE